MNAINIALILLVPTLSLAACGTGGTIEFTLKDGGAAGADASGGMGGATSMPSSSSGMGGMGGAGGEEPLPDPADASPACLPNGGFTCVDDSDCPHATGCPFTFACETIPLTDPPEYACVAHYPDGGTP